MPQQDTIHTSRNRNTRAWFDGADQIKNRMNWKEEEIWRNRNKKDQIHGADQFKNKSQPEKTEICIEMEISELVLMVCIELTTDGLFSIFQGIWNH